MTDDDDQKEFDRKQKKTQKIVLVIVVPLIIMSAGLFILSDLNSEEKPSITEILSQIDLECYNVNWFGVQGFQTTYMTTIEKVGLKLDEYDIDFSNEAFFKEPEVIEHLIRNCPHIDSRLEIPTTFDPFIGVPALDKCLEIKRGMFEPEEICMQYKD